jgi:hypothetical protein
VQDIDPNVMKNLPMELADLLLQGMAMSMKRVGESTLQKAMMGMLA